MTAAETLTIITPRGLSKEYLMVEHNKLLNAISYGVSGNKNLEWAKIKIGKIEEYLNKNYPGWNR